MAEPGLHEVSVVVVLHNSAEVVAECLATLPAEVELVVVDNASSDGGAQIVERTRPDARVIVSPSNRGFGGGCQLGAAAATRPLLMFLNPDAQIDADSIIRLTRTLSEHPLGIVGPRLLDAAGAPRPIRHELDIRQDALWLLPFALRWLPARYRRQAPPDRDGEYEVGFVEGACFMIRAADLGAVGGFDPDLFLYFEEPSLAHRLRRRGGANWYEPRASATHIGEISTGKATTFATYHFFRSRVILERKVRGDAGGRLRSLSLLAAGSIYLLRALVHRLLPGRQSAVPEALAVVRGVFAGLRAPVDARYC